MRRIPQLDGLRGIAILMVFLFHAFHVRSLWMGVDLFFVLSGYLITGILLRLKDKRATAGYWAPFYFRRMRRIVPPYLGFILVLVLFVRLPWPQIWYWYAFPAANIAAALRVAPKVIAPLWSLAVEEQFYFVWPLIVLLCSRKILGRIAMAVVLAAPLLRAICTPLFSNAEPIYNLTPFRADLLACGALVAIWEAQDTTWVQRMRRSSLYLAVSATILLAFFSLFAAFRANANTVFFNTFGYSLVVTICGGTLVCALGMQGGMAYNMLTAGPLRLLGKISYTFYLYQVLVLESLRHYLHRPLLVGFIAFSIAFTISAFSWLYIESPILKLRADFRKSIFPKLRDVPDARPNLEVVGAQISAAAMACSGNALFITEQQGRETPILDSPQ